MENWIMVNKLMIAGYIVLQYVSSNFRNNDAVLFFLLAYICLSITVYLVKKRIYQGILVGITIMLLVACTLFLNGLFILLLPASIYEGVFLYRANPWLACILAIIPLLITEKVLQNHYLLVGSQSLLLALLADKSSHRIRMLLGENDMLREKLFSLSGRLNKNLDHERQLRYTSQLEERNKIAQEIHDQLGQTLSGSLLQLEAARMYLATNPAKSEAVIQNVIQVLRTGMDHLRATLINIKPPSEQLGLNRIKLMLGKFRADNHIQTVLLHQGNLERISPSQWKIIHDNIHEALTNILKHSRATVVTVNIETLHKFIKAEVRDNGVGANSITKGLGLRGMEERSGQAGGQIIVDGSRGFSIITLLPLGGE